MTPCIPIDPFNVFSQLQEKAESLIDLQRQEATSSDSYNSKKKRDRFNGMTEEDVLKRTVPDLLCPNLDIIIVSTLVFNTLSLFHALVVLLFQFFVKFLKIRILMCF